MTVWDGFQDSRAIEGLRSLIAAGVSPHSWLLLGPRGSGKHATARAMAAALDCRVIAGIGCGECSSCSRIMRGRHPDVHHIVPEGPIISVDVIREQVVPEAARSPFEAPYKLFVIEEADRMNDPAQNALLKTLEEPHPDTVFILLSDHEEELLETVRSRCHLARLEPVSEHRIVESLTSEGIDEAEARTAARASNGDLERARRLCSDARAMDRRRQWLNIPARLDSPVAALDAAVEIMDEARAVTKEHEEVQKQEIAELAETLGEGRRSATVRNAMAKRHRRESRRLEEEVVGEALETVASFYRDVVVARTGGDGLSNLDLGDRLTPWVDAPPPDGALMAIGQRCLETRSAIARNANPSLGVEAVLLEIVRLAPSPVAETP